MSSGEPANDNAKSATEADLARQCEEFAEKLRQCEADYGSKHPAVADILEEFAAFLRKNQIRALDAANFSARAKVIRGEKSKPGGSSGSTGLLEELEFDKREPKNRGGKTVLSICAALLLLFAGSLAGLVQTINAKIRAVENESIKERYGEDELNAPLNTAAVDLEGGGSGVLVNATQVDPGGRIS